MGVTGHELVDAARSDSTGRDVFTSIFQGRTPESVFSVLLANKQKWEAMYQGKDKWEWNDIPDTLERELQNSQGTLDDVKQKATIWPAAK
jgi:hypothetical protein